ncbi:MAG: phosphoribosylformimino-5-aminoimidazole carboxamide ribotide isomerase [Eubacterium sp.]|nr:phosphoribosylformimino-5-aminoimidazole carboxamide ribotide isomerase [Eubacterium sp.]
MKFRPCIDIHGGKVKQIVGGSLDDSGAKENFVSDMSAAGFAKMYASDGLAGGHIILLDKAGTDAYKADFELAKEALRAYPGRWQIGGGVNPENAEEFLDAGASHVIVTSYVFDDGQIHFDRIDELKFVTGKNRLVLDLSVRKKDGEYYVVTDRWQKFTKHVLSASFINDLSYYCDEFLVHAVDVEGKQAGPDEELISMLSDAKAIVTYAGGIGSYEDIDVIKAVGGGKVDFTIGSALDIFGGELLYKSIINDFS